MDILTLALCKKQIVNFINTMIEDGTIESLE